MQLVLTLPLPHTDLRPNACPHRHVKAALIRTARENAKRAMFTLMKGIECPCWILKGYTFKAYFKTKRHWDSNAIVGAAKSAEDGVADAIGQNDRTFELLGVIRDTDRENPRLEIILEIEELV